MPIADHADCGLRISDCGFRIADFGLRISDCGFRKGSHAVTRPSPVGIMKDDENKQSEIRNLQSAIGLAEFLGLRANIVALLVAMIVIGGGEELWIRFVPKYLEVLGAGTLVIGIYDGLKTLLGAVYAYPGGILTDRWGHRKALSFFTALSVAGYLMVFAIPHWAAVLGATFFFLAWASFSLPATFSLVGTNLAPEKYGMGIALQSIIKRIPILVGPVLGGILIDRFGVHDGIRLGLLASIVLGLIAMLVQNRISEVPLRGARDVRLPFSLALTQFRPELRRLLLSDILVRFCERIPAAWVVIIVMSRAGLGGREFGYLTALEVGVAMLCFIPVAYVSDRYGRELFVILTFVFFTLFPLVLLQAVTLPRFALAFAIRGLKEFGEPARKALIIQYSKGLNQGQLIGAYYLIRDITVTPGALLGAWLWAAGPEVNFWGAFLFGLVGTAYYASTIVRSD
jgi:MFS family permease